MVLFGLTGQHFQCWYEPEVLKVDRSQIADDPPQVNDLVFNQGIQFLEPGTSACSVMTEGFQRHLAALLQGDEALNDDIMELMGQPRPFLFLRSVMAVR